MSLFLVDTSAWLWALRRNPVEAIRRRIDELVTARLAATTGVVQVELLGGTRTDREFEDLAWDLGSLHQLAIRNETWTRAARLAFDLRRRGLTVPLTDVLMASTALENDATIVHADVHYDRIAEHTELNVESYVRDIERQTPA